MNKNTAFATEADDLRHATPEEIRLLRKRMGMTQAELAAELGVNDYAVFRWENRLKAMDKERGTPAGEPMRTISEEHTRALRALASKRVGYLTV